MMYVFVVLLLMITDGQCTMEQSVSGKEVINTTLYNGIIISYHTQDRHARETRAGDEAPRVNRQCSSLLTKKNDGATPKKTRHFKNIRDTVNGQTDDKMFHREM